MLNNLLIGYMLCNKEKPVWTTSVYLWISMINEREELKDVQAVLGTAHPTTLRVAYCEWRITPSCFADCWTLPEELIYWPVRMWMSKCLLTIVWCRMSINHVQKSINTATVQCVLKHHIILVQANRGSPGFSCIVYEKKTLQSSIQRWDKDPTPGLTLHKYGQFSLNKIVDNETRWCIGGSAINISLQYRTAFCWVKCTYNTL